MNKPIVFDAIEAKKYGLIESIVYQKVREGFNELPLLKKELNFILVKDIEQAVKKLSELRIFFFNGFEISLEEIKNNVVDVHHSYDTTFDELWKYYNSEKKNKGSKKIAYQRYIKNKFSKLPLEIQKKVVDEYRSDTSDVKFMKHFSTFISEEIYEEYAPDVCTLSTTKGQIQGYLFNDYFFYLNNNGTYSNFDLAGKIDEYKKSHILTCK